jgi:predicted HTH transcriptional regulator
MHQHLKKLIRQGEGDMLDYKQEISSASKIAKTMSSFANNRGGVILVGVRDNQTVAGIRTEDEKYMLELAADFYIKPPLTIELVDWFVEGKTVIECKIPEGIDKPYYARSDDDKWWAYVRVKDQSLLASKIVLDVLRKENRGENNVLRFTRHEEILLEFLRDNNKILLKDYCQMANLSKRRASRILVNLISMGVIRNHTTEKMEYFTLS